MKPAFSCVGLVAAWSLLASLAVGQEMLPDPAARPPLSTGTPEAPVPPKDFLYDGNYWSVLGGLSLTQLDRPLPGVAQWGAGGRLALRFSSITQFLDVETGVEYSRHGAAAAKSGVTDGSWSRLEVGGSAHLHPGFPLIAFNDFWNDIFSGVHGLLGVSVVRGELTGTNAVAKIRDGGTSEVDWRPCITLGAGVDIPVSPRNRNDGWWLTARYNLRWMRFGDGEPDWPQNDNQILLLLGYRQYNNSFARLPRPW
jgi:hypothetical protein